MWWKMPTKLDKAENGKCLPLRIRKGEREMSVMGSKSLDDNLNFLKLLKVILYVK